MVDISKLKARSGQSSLDSLTKKLEALNPKKESYDDDRFWYPKTDKAGNGYAVIRFLPAHEDEDVELVRLYKFSFKGPSGLWYIENSLETVGKTDPVSELFFKLRKDTAGEANNKLANLLKRKVEYISNIYVVSDPAAPENEGKVFLFRYGQQIYNKIHSAMYPEFPDDEKYNPFDLWTGANLKVKIRNNEGGYRNYERSEFDRQSEFGDDEKIIKVMGQVHKLQEFVAPTQFKDYDTLKEKVNKVLFSEGVERASADETLDDDEDEVPVRTQTRSAPEPEKETVPFVVDSDDEDDDETMAFFKGLT